MSRTRVLSRRIVTAFILTTLLGSAPALLAQAPKIAVIDVQRVLAESTPGKEVQAQLEGLRSQKRTELEGRQQELRDLQARITEQQLSLAPDKLQELRKELEDKAIAFERAQNDANRELQQRGENLVGQMEQRIIPLIDTIGREQGYTLIFNKFQSGLLYAADSVDITSMVIERMNAASGG